MPKRADNRLRILFVAIVVAGCTGGSPAASATGVPTAGPTVASGPTTSPASPAPEPSTEASPAGPHLSLVGLGDSVPGGLKCNDPCRSYVLTYGELAAAALGEAVVTTNLATNDGLESDTLLGRIQHDESYRSAIQAADIVTLQVGWNDWQGPCNFANRASCLALGILRVKPNVDGILAEIKNLRAGKKSAIRVLTYYNGFLGNSNTPDIWGFSAGAQDRAAFDTDFRAALAEFNAMLCDVAAAHDALCVKVGPSFNGRNLDEPARAGLINSDGIHGLAAGHALLASLLDKAGYAPLR